MLSLPVLKSPFRPAEAFRDSPGSYRLLPMRFETLDERRIVVSNLAGDFVVMTRADLAAVLDRKCDPDSPMYKSLVARHFIAEGDFSAWYDLLAAAYRTRFAPIAEFTGLHMFVVTLRCDHSCPYCQVSRVSEDRSVYDMTPETALRGVDLVFRSPSSRLKIEFQGGESLLNFPLIRLIVEAAEARNAVENRDLTFVAATNLAPLTDDMLEYFEHHQVRVSTSLDGPAWLHNANRPRPGSNSHELAVRGIERCRQALGEDAVSALMTTTRRSLDAPDAIIDEYVRLGFRSVFLRWLSPYGFATRSQRALGYDVAAWNQFYERGLRHILRLNGQGIGFQEELASIVLRKMLTPMGSGFVDLQSPTGLGLSAVVYNYDGDVYASDESRMLAETGDTTFRLGTVRDRYEDLFGGVRLRSWIDQTMTESTPQCRDCGFEPWCGTDPTLHHALQGDMVGHRPTSPFCHRNMGLFRLLVRVLEDEPQAATILRGWTR